MSRRLGWRWGLAVGALAAVVVAAAWLLVDDEPTEAERLAHGEELYQANCAECHGGATGGDITDIPPPHNAEGHTWHHGDCELIRWTLEGMPPRPEVPEGMEMPAFEDQLTEEDVEAVLAHIKTWWTEEQREVQARVTGQVC